jgi:hypothetical protein
VEIRNRSYQPRMDSGQSRAARPRERGSSGVYFAQAGSETTLGISIFAAAFRKALHWSGFRNVTEHPDQA